MAISSLPTLALALLCLAAYSAAQCPSSAPVDCNNGFCCYSGYSCCNTGQCCKSSTCFPGNATVQLESGSSKQMHELNTGDRVRVSAEEFSDVFMFSHRLEETKSLFVELVTAGPTIRLTPDHYLYVNGKLATARTVKIGDKLIAADGSAVEVEKIDQVWANGLYNPHTMQGDVIVDGIRTSTYTEAINPTLAHAALWPVRMMYSAGIDIVGDAFDHGTPANLRHMPLLPPQEVKQAVLRSNEDAAVRPAVRAQ